MTDKLNDKQKETIMGAIPMRRMGTGAEIASAVLYLAIQRSRLCHRSDDPCEWRHGDDFDVIDFNRTLRPAEKP